MFYWPEPILDGARMLLVLFSQQEPDELGVAHLGIWRAVELRHSLASRHSAREYTINQPCGQCWTSNTDLIINKFHKYSIVQHNYETHKLQTIKCHIDFSYNYLRHLKRLQPDIFIYTVIYKNSTIQLVWIFNTRLQARSGTKIWVVVVQTLAAHSFWGVETYTLKGLTKYDH